MAEGWRASRSPWYPGVCVARHTGALKSVWARLLLCLMSLPADNLHWSRGELSVKLLLLCVKACKLNVSPHCRTFLDLMLSAKCRLRGKHFHQTEHTSTRTQTHLSRVLQTRRGIKHLFFCCPLSFGAQDSHSHDSWLDFFSSFLPAQISSYFISSIHIQRPFTVPQ